MYNPFGLELVLYGGVFDRFFLFGPETIRDFGSRFILFLEEREANVVHDPQKQRAIQVARIVYTWSWEDEKEVALGT